jgi:hypothetical protein
MSNLLASVLLAIVMLLAALFLLCAVSAARPIWEWIDGVENNSAVD